MGFTLMGRILVDAGFTVKLIDYSYLKGIRHYIEAPTVEDAVREFKPDVVGVSVFTYLYDEAQDIIERISKCTSAPIMVGGPHVTLFPDDFSNDPRISFVVRGEAEMVILDLVSSATRQQKPVVVTSPPPPPEMIPEVNLDIALGCEYIKEYQIQLSRGCPFHCSFCTIDFVAGRRVRGRDIDLCLSQIAKAKKRFPTIETVSITDDCPTYNRKRFKEFLAKFAVLGTEMMLTIDNVRADLIDEEMIQLYVLANGQNMCLGAESGHPEVFKLVHKGETLEHIRAAAGLIRKYNLTLGLCFVIGLPEDTIERHKSSIRLAKELKADYIYWNMCVPWPGTEIHKWFQENGSIGDIRNFSTLIDLNIEFKDPPAVSRIFPKEDRIKAWLMANLETATLPIFSGSFLLNLKNLPRNILRLLRFTIKYNLYSSLLIFIKEFFLRKIPYEIKRRVRKQAFERRRRLLIQERALR